MRATRQGWGRLAVLLAATMLLAACGSSQVVRRVGDRGPVQVSQPRYGTTVTVRRGQTLYRIATDNGITARDLAAWNGIAPPYTIYPGQRLRLYPGGGARATGTAHAGAVRPRTGAPRPPATPAPAAAPPSSPFVWRWPVQGTLLARYVAGETTRQGIDIGAVAGTPVHAAADGVVVYSGSGLVGYGELIIVKHDEQWLSAYGHNRARLVNEGQLVKAGQQIAELGHSGAARDMLHFEIRYNGKPVDPLVYLPQR
nr:peptidoglycan DD-metalloendopeptidase family protein [Luteimonas weifangensis]